MVSVLKKNIVTAYKELDAVRSEAQNFSQLLDRRNGRLQIEMFCSYENEFKALCLHLILEFWC